MRYLRILLLFTCLFLGIVGNLVAQSTRLSLHYINKPLKEVLFELERDYKIHFSYAQDRLELNKRVSIRIYNQPLPDALKQIFKVANISYYQAGDRWVLKNAPSKQDSYSNTTPKTLPQISPLEHPLKINPKKKDSIQLNSSTVVKENIISPPPSNKTIAPLHVSAISSPESMPDMQRNILKRLRSDVIDVFQSWKVRKAAGELKVFQISTFGTRAKNSQKTNIIGFSLGWGVHGSLEGLQASILGTAIRRNAIGLQIAGLFNGVGKDMMGLQIAGLFNSSKGDVMGMQIGGLLNSSNRMMGSQITAGLNISKGKLMGMQFAGIGNIASKSANSAQIATGFNLTKEVSNFQASGMYNKAGSIEGVQITAGINEAETVKGVQIGSVNRTRKITGLQLGIINMADTVKGVSIGLINIIKNGGYNRLEVSGGESVQVIASLRMGPKSLYHIYQGGFNIWGRAWGLGGGLGSIIKLDRRWNLNIEATTMHINEDKKWTNELNLLSQAKATFEYNIDKDFSIFVGPSVNVMVSKYIDEETGIRGSTVPMYTIFDLNALNGVNTKFWLGFQTGVRMRLW